MGVGRTIPDPAASLIMKDKVEIPLGKPIPSNVDDTVLLYNEYPFIHLIALLFEMYTFNEYILSINDVFSLILYFLDSLFMIFHRLKFVIWFKLILNLTINITYD